MAGSLSHRGITVLAVLIAAGIVIANVSQSGQKKSATLLSQDAPPTVTYIGDGLSFVFPQYLQSNRTDISSASENANYYRYHHSTIEASPADTDITIEKFIATDKSLKNVEHPDVLWSEIKDIQISDNGKANGFASDPIAFPGQDASHCLLRYEYLWPHGKHIYRITFSVSQTTNPLLDKKITDCHIYKPKEHDLYIRIMTEILSSLQVRQ